MPAAPCRCLFSLTPALQSLPLILSISVENTDLEISPLPKVMQLVNSLVGIQSQVGLTPEHLIPELCCSQSSLEGSLFPMWETGCSEKLKLGQRHTAGVLHFPALLWVWAFTPWPHGTLFDCLWCYSDQWASHTKFSDLSGPGGLHSGSVGTGSTAQMVFILTWLLCVYGYLLIKNINCCLWSNIKKYYESPSANKKLANVFLNPSLTK